MKSWPSNGVPPVSRRLELVFRVLFLSFIALLPARAFAAAKPSTPEAAPASPREFFNAGTEKLAEAVKLLADKKPIESKLREAEALLESALASQSERLQPPSLYNLGHVRFGQGAEELKK